MTATCFAMIIFAAVKKLFSSIGILITLSLTGIIIMQISWLKNLIALREDQVKQKIENAFGMVANEMTQLKAQYAPPPPLFDDPGLILRRNYDLLHPVTIGSRLNSKDIYEKIRKAFDTTGLEKLKFEFALAYAPSGSNIVYITQQSQKYYESIADSAHNYIAYPRAILSPSGSPSEGQAGYESLFLVTLNWKNYVKRSLVWTIALAVLFTFVIVSAFYLTVYTMLRQKKLSDIKNDFINNMTHEFKTPIATISLAVDALKNEKVMGNREKMGYFSGIIKEENQRMNKQVETILKASQFEKQETELDMKPLHVHEVIENVVDNFQLQLHEKNGEAQLNLVASKDMIHADDVHFTNLVNNLIDNAIKYSKENIPIHLKITTVNSGNNVVIKFEDNGIGMSKETQRRVFEKFYRAHTGNLHNVKGFGLGLSYVKSVTESHHGSIKVDSMLGRGSVFTLEFPAV